jgi:hypothetical protein
MTDETGSPEPIQQPADWIVQLREELMPDGAFEWEVAAALGCSRRKVQRLDLPYRKVGSTRIYNVTGSRKALQCQPPPEAA